MATCLSNIVLQMHCFVVWVPWVEALAERPRQVQALVYAVLAGSAWSVSLSLVVHCLDCGSIRKFTKERCHMVLWRLLSRTTEFSFLSMTTYGPGSKVVDNLFRFGVCSRTMSPCWIVLLVALLGLSVQVLAACRADSSTVQLDCGLQLNAVYSCRPWETPIVLCAFPSDWAEWVALTCSAFELCHWSATSMEWCGGVRPRPTHVNG